MKWLGNTCYLTELQEQLSRQNHNQEAEEITEDGALRQAYVLLSPDNKSSNSFTCLFISVQDSKFRDQDFYGRKVGPRPNHLECEGGRSGYKKEMEIKRGKVHDMIID